MHNITAYILPFLALIFVANQFNHCFGAVERKHFSVEHKNKIETSPKYAVIIQSNVSTSTGRPLKHRGNGNIIFDAIDHQRNVRLPRSLIDRRKDEISNDSAFWFSSRRRPWIQRRAKKRCRKFRQKRRRTICINRVIAERSFRHGRHHHRRRHHHSLRCALCAPGQFVQTRCNATHDTVCAPCPTKTYRPHHSARTSCMACSQCGDTLFVLHQCGPRTDTVCDSCETLRTISPSNADYQLKCKP